MRLLFMVFASGCAVTSVSPSPELAAGLPPLTPLTCADSVAGWYQSQQLPHLRYLFADDGGIEGSVYQMPAAPPVFRPRRLRLTDAGEVVAEALAADAGAQVRLPVRLLLTRRDGGLQGTSVLAADDAGCFLAFPLEVQCVDGGLLVVSHPPAQGGSSRCPGAPVGVTTRHQLSPLLPKRRER